MRDANGLRYRLRLMNLLEPWRTPLQHIHDIAYENLRDIDLRTVLLSLRDMRYGPPVAGNTTFDCLNEWRATAVAKHFAIHNLLSLIGLSPALWMANYHVTDNLPLGCDILTRAASKFNVQDVHVYLTCDFGEGERIVDFTYPQHMACQSFTVNQDWNTYEDCTLPFALQESRPIEASAAGLLHIQIWRQKLNPGMGMHYNNLIHAHIIKHATRDDATETRREYIHRHYLRQLPAQQRTNAGLVW